MHFCVFPVANIKNLNFVTIKTQIPMNISKLILSVAASVMMLASCAPTPDQRTDEALKAIMEEFQTVGHGCNDHRLGSCRGQELLAGHCQRGL